MWRHLRISHQTFGLRIRPSQQTHKVQIILQRKENKKARHGNFTYFFNRMLDMSTIHTNFCYALSERIKYCKLHQLLPKVKFIVTSPITVVHLFCFWGRCPSYLLSFSLPRASQTNRAGQISNPEHNATQIKTAFTVQIKSCTPVYRLYWTYRSAIFLDWKKWESSTYAKKLKDKMLKKNQQWSLVSNSTKLNLGSNNLTYSRKRTSDI